VSFSWKRILLFVAGCLAFSATRAEAQSSSLLGPPEARPPLTLSGHSWLFNKVEPIRQVQVNDIVTIIVSEKSEVSNDGQIQQRGQNNVDLNLQDWVMLDGFGLQHDKVPSASNPRVRGTFNNQYRTTAQLDLADSMAFRIAARVVDILPNGNLVLEAHNRSRNNDEIWERSLTGICRREDVTPQNTVQSEKIYELSIHKREEGQIRTAYRPGWLLKAINTYRPF
jgi:flagellar L-ring protein precursor FlgH